ncbi:hypothetical protein B9Q04_06120 [Candidatus Marsarchaeota G2 archaeon BE_D]|uniref:Uncharacterized protein n=1 Tax=Candidatus Marsarchaeota G2 archaeon BE_D TaxID=1978158 RepID=A0A2R6CBQ8_9ARCH|nr:MAG: hypothetical protein B9Q04_06120 [Candidatus Marsarchaeota G2 archaeon BE_D]
MLGLESWKSPITKWGWFSEPPGCPPNERCKSETMVGTMSHHGKEPSPFSGCQGSRCHNNKPTNPRRAISKSHYHKT